MFGGKVQVYTGDGKGKTTAAVGLSVRALGAGLRVFFAQFIKSRESSEFTALAAFGERFCLRRFGMGFVWGAPSQEDKDAAQAGLLQARESMLSSTYDIVVLDEINVAISCGLISSKDIVELIKDRPDGVELVLTGRGAPEEITAAADLVTELKEIKHYYHSGVKARKGIEY
ncbi:cob(I)yrinic acid a,c-diamide adenosyltransferase [Candidatus Magnetominusculus xianensis]|uniref:corrinoid adenosyltransferase n=1 Tax=Candidatus Magnetominusculus xianensis TaxID=1748249 RepID=A0ABR5SDW2_9BACT|nr:cob(I)yrinic acid a,c-diamide adenosyltransferase [Candidatus Magnetominusculus xianensis]KWT83679.1 cob(I)alamin adenolsyltransferase/cobinamide ATP-dependent adenolsyltransferase [Candidatus Magnetominusculus xianensis]MBF0402623.1 cob(I)yrinic acid a,c-diamide adenosyltransferase [Nitrospirota bacterium]